MLVIRSKDMIEKPHPHGHRIIGWREVVSFPEWDVAGIDAKLDTGARTSAIHVEDVQQLSRNRVRFHLVISHQKPFKSVAVSAKLVRLTRIRSSTGHLQERYVIETVVRIGPVKRRIEASLVGRDKMLCRMLLGRTALQGFLIDPTAKYIYGSPKRTTSTKKVKAK